MTRTNLLLNGAFGSGVTGWTAEQATISADSGRMRVIPSSSSWTVSSDSTPVTPGQWVSLAADITASDSPADLCLRFAGTDGPAPRASAPAGSTGRVVVTAQAPDGATTVQAALAASTGGVAAYPPLSSRDAWELGAAVQAADGVAAGAWVVPAGADVSDGKATVTGTLSMGIPAAAVAGHTLALSWSASTTVADTLVQRGGFHGVTADGVLKKSYLARGFQGLTDTETAYKDSVTIPSGEALAEDGVEVVYPVVFLAAGVTFTRVEVVDETTQTLWTDNAILQVGDAQGDVSDTSFFDGDTRPVRIGNTGKALVYSWTGVPGGSPSREEVGRWPIFTLTAIIPDGDAPVVQVIVPGLYARSGTRVRVTGHTPDGFSWVVRGSGSMGNGSQLVLGDALAPVNTPLTYRIVQPWDGQTVESTPVTRPCAGPADHCSRDPWAPNSGDGLRPSHGGWHGLADGPHERGSHADDDSSGRPPDYRSPVPQSCQVLPVPSRSLRRTADDGHGPDFGDAGTHAPPGPGGAGVDHQRNYLLGPGAAAHRRPVHLG